MRNTAAASALLAATLCIGAGVTATAHADSADVMNYTATATETSTIVRTDLGSMTVEDGVFKIKAANGTVLAGTELSFRVDDFVFPIAADIKDRTATLTPGSTRRTPSTSRSPCPTRTRPPGRPPTTANRRPGVACATPSPSAPPSAPWSAAWAAQPSAASSAAPSAWP